MTKRFFFLSTLIVGMFLTACSNSEPQATPPNNPPAQTAPETKPPSDKGASTDDRNVVKAEGAVAVIPPDPSAATPQANPATPAIADAGKAPKIELPVKKIDFGKVKADKKILKDFVVKNVGKAPLNIESVTPG
jgi:hypothetical protein